MWWIQILKEDTLSPCPDYKKMPIETDSDFKYLGRSRGHWTFKLLLLKSVFQGIDCSDAYNPPWGRREWNNETQKKELCQNSTLQERTSVCI